MQKRYKTQQIEIIDKPIKDFEEKTILLIARSLNDMVDDVVWVRVLNTTLKHRKIYKNARIVCEENIEKISRIYKNPVYNTKSIDEFDFEKHMNGSSMSL